MTTTPDFNQFGDELGDIANVFRDDALHATERLEIFSLFLFLKLWDEMAAEDEEARGTPLPDDQQLIPDVYRFHRWAPDPDGYARAQGFPDSIEFCRKMFSDLAQRESSHPTARDVRRLFSDVVFPLRYPTTVRALASRVKRGPRNRGEPGQPAWPPRNFFPRFPLGILTRGAGLCIMRSVGRGRERRREATRDGEEQGPHNPEPEELSRRPDC